MSDTPEKREEQLKARLERLDELEKEIKKERKGFKR